MKNPFKRELVVRWAEAPVTHESIVRYFSGDPQFREFIAKMARSSAKDWIEEFGDKFIEDHLKNRKID